VIGVRSNKRRTRDLAGLGVLFSACLCLVVDAPAIHLLNLLGLPGSEPWALYLPKMALLFPLFGAGLWLLDPPRDQTAIHETALRESDHLSRARQSMPLKGRGVSR
jgi:hypothetical protein